MSRPGPFKSGGGIGISDGDGDGDGLGEAAPAESSLGLALAPGLGLELGTGAPGAALAVVAPCGTGTCATVAVACGSMPQIDFEARKCLTVGSSAAASAASADDESEGVLYVPASAMLGTRSAAVFPSRLPRTTSARNLRDRLGFVNVPRAKIKTLRHFPG